MSDPTQPPPNNAYKRLPDGPNFFGHVPRECGEHRSVGSHRAWCFECSEWCYPRDDGACKGCRIPQLETRIRKLTAEREAQREELERRDIS